MEGTNARVAAGKAALRSITLTRLKRVLVVLSPLEGALGRPPGYGRNLPSTRVVPGRGVLKSPMWLGAAGG